MGAFGGMAWTTSDGMFGTLPLFRPIANPHSKQPLQLGTDKIKFLLGFEGSARVLDPTLREGDRGRLTSLGEPILTQWPASQLHKPTNNYA